MSPFEIFMLICFGLAWPFSIATSIKTKRNSGKSLLFLYIVLAGYVAGCLHKAIYNHDIVIFLYILNGCMVAFDIALYHRYASQAECRTQSYGQNLKSCIVEE